MTEKADHLTGLEIAIIGMACRFPGARDIEEFWKNLQEGNETITFFSDEALQAIGVRADVLSQPNYARAGGVPDDIEGFDASFFGFNPREAEIMDPQPNRDLVAALGGLQTVIANDSNFLTTRVSYKLDLRGPGVTIQAACSTSLVAIHLASQSLLSGECDIALAGGVSISASQRAGYFYQEGGILSPDDHCRAFDVNAKGTVPGGGAGIVVLKRLTRKRKSLCKNQPFRISCSHRNASSRILRVRRSIATPRSTNWWVHRSTSSMKTTSQ